jgi:hypothetical protein
MPYKKKPTAQQTADASRGGRSAAKIQQKDSAGYRLSELRASPAYKRWLRGSVAQEKSMDTVDFRALDRSKGRGSQG